LVLEDLGNVVGLSGSGGRVTIVASLGIVKLGIEASSSGASSGGSGSKIGRSSEGSSDEHVLSVSTVGNSVSSGEESSRDPVDVSSSNERVGERSVWHAVGGVKLVSDGISSSKADVSSNGKSSLDISGVGNEVSEGDGVELSKREGRSSEVDVQSSAVSLE